MADEITLAGNGVSDATGAAGTSESSVNAADTVSSTETSSHDNMSIFGERYSEAELMGGDISDGDGAMSGTAGEKADVNIQSGEATAENTADSGQKAENVGGTDGKTGDDKENADGNKPPKGFVPNEALKAERQKRKDAQARIAELEKQLADMERVREDLSYRSDTVSAESVHEDVLEFVKAHPEYRDVVLENSKDGEALRESIEVYGESEALWKARTVRMEKQLSAKKEADTRMSEENYGNTILREMDRLFSDGSRTGKEASELVGYARERGVSDETINLLTNPYTIIVDPATGRQMKMGGKAYELVSFMQDSFQNSRAFNRDAMMAELEPIITDRVMKKLGGRTQSEFRDIGAAAGHETAPGNYKNLSEAQLSKLNPEQLEAYLLGEY